MTTVSHQFTDLDTIIDDLHAIFYEWEKNAAFQPPLDETSFHWVRLAIHEWIANLAQHAEFADREPCVFLSASAEQGRLQCIVEDNSNGFDLEEQIAAQEHARLSLPPPDRGMGLLFLRACTETLRYDRIAPDRQRLYFSLSASHDPCLNIQF